MKSLSLVRPARVMPKSSRNSSCLSRSGDRKRPQAMSLTLMTGIMFLLKRFCPEDNTGGAREPSFARANDPARMGREVYLIRGVPQRLTPVGERRFEPQRQLLPFRRTQKGAQTHRLAMRGEREPVLPLFPLLIDDAQPE